MSKQATILPINKPLPAVKYLLSPQEENLVALIATVIVDNTLKKVYEEGNSLPPFQPRRSK